MISHERKFLFVDIVKTAGTAIARVLQQYGGRGKHHSVCRRLPALPENCSLNSPISPRILEAYFCFTFVRNPYDRLISLFSYCQQAPLQRSFAESGWKALSSTCHSPLPERARERKTYWPTDLPVFLDWLSEHNLYYCDFTGEKYIPMKDWIVDGHGVVRVDFVGRHEQLQQDLNIVLKKIGATPCLVPMTNESSNAHKRDAAKMIQSSRHLQSQIQTYFRHDFECFGYSTHFEECAAGRFMGSHHKRGLSRNLQ